ncbi:MAG: PAS domain S-box protein [Nitrospirae bacterium]|nr:MAG: PAS domain S-box protein [Nitrospirota bacterium]
MGLYGYILEILAQIGGGRGDPGNNVVRFLIPALLFSVLIIASLRQWRHSRYKRDLVISIAASIGLFRELLMLAVETGAWLGFLPHELTHPFFPPLEHTLSIFSEILIAYAFMRFYSETTTHPNIFLLICSMVLITLYLVSAPLWYVFISDNPDARFGMFWADITYRGIASSALFYTIFTFIMMRKRGKPLPVLLILGITFFFSDESLMIISLLHNEVYAGTINPIRHNLHIWAVPLFLYIYWGEIRREIEELGRIRDIAFEVSPDLLIISDYSGRIIQASPASTPILEMSHSLLKGKSITEFGVSEDALRRITIKGMTQDIQELEIKRRSTQGAPVWTRWRIRPLMTDQLLYISVTDITDEKINRESLRLLEQINTAILSGIPIEAILEDAAILSREIFGFASFDIYLKADRKSELIPVALAISQPLREMLEQEMGRPLETFRIPLKPDSSFTEVMRSGETVITEDIPGALEDFSSNPDDLNKIRMLSNRLGFKSIIRVPLRIDEGIIGVAGAAREGKISPQDRNRLEIFCTQLAMAIKKGRLESELRESEKRFREVMEQNDEGILIIDAETGNLLYSNSAFSVITGIDREVLFHNPSALLEPFVGGYPTSEPAGDSTRKITFRRHDGEEKRILVKKKFVSSPPRNLIVVTCKDETLEYHLEKKRHEIQAKLIQANKMTSLGLLVSGVVHEVNNPNNFIRTNAQLLEGLWPDINKILKEFSTENGDFSAGGLPLEELESTVPDLIKGIIEGSRRIQSIIDNLKGFGRSTRDEFSPVDINRAVMSALSILNPEIKRYTNHFTFNLHPDIPLIIGNEQQIEQVVINLLLNALQALPGKDWGVRLSTSVNRQGKNAIIEIKDDGIGMEPEILEHLGEPFFTTRAESGGTGLGISISKTIVADHGGRLEFESTPGEGTTARVILPVKEPEQYETI